MHPSKAFFFKFYLIDQRKPGVNSLGWKSFFIQRKRKESNMPFFKSFPRFLLCPKTPVLEILGSPLYAFFNFRILESPCPCLPLAEQMV